MKTTTVICACLAVIFAFIGNASARGSRTQLSVVIGAPAYGWHAPQPYYRPYARPYYPPYHRPYYSPPIVIERVAPPIYVEQPVLQVAPPISVSQPETNYWYYCEAHKAYYPYAKECPAGWMKVVPQTPAS